MIEITVAPEPRREGETVEEDEADLDEEVIDKGTGRKIHKKRKREDEDPSRPKIPHTGYVRFLLEHRDQVASENPHLALPEVTRAVAARWRAATPEQKQPYLDAAESDKKKYNEEMRLYHERAGHLKSRAVGPKPGEATCATAPATPTPDSIARAPKPARRSVVSAAQDLPALDDANLDVAEMFCRPCQQYFSSVHNMREHLHGRKHRLMTGETLEEEEAFNVPIFTEEFLRHNKSREQELKELRRSNVQFEEQNRALTQANAKLREALQKLEEDASHIVADNTVLRAQLASMQDMIVSAFAELPLPPGSAAPKDSIEEHLAKLAQALETPPINPLLVQKLHLLFARILQQTSALQPPTA
eukprot:m.229859 g.229859  ORF g.229859 m.229859 type:complete len:360 (+) comp11964_c0_seq1:61-1140(+)